MSIVRNLLGKQTKRGRALRLTLAIVLGFLCAQALRALGITGDVPAIPVAAIVASVLMLPRHQR
jgi:hypothetical protein